MRIGSGGRAGSSPPDDGPPAKGVIRSAEDGDEDHGVATAGSPALLLAHSKVIGMEWNR